jgi:putative PLP-dependent aminotransferase (TIGR04422 family)
MQWPSGTAKIKFLRLIYDVFTTNNHIRRAQIEDFFLRLTGYEVLLFSSARNALYAVTEVLELNRDKKVYLPPFSALCLYECFGRKMNISTDLISPNVLVINHKWGTIQTTKCNDEKVFIIEDSCDAYLGLGERMFPNKGRIQVISLPKILGTVSGGLIFFNNPNDELRKKLRDRQLMGKTRHRLFLKKLIYYKFDMKFQKNWEQIEFDSRGVSWGDTLQILNVLKEYESNRLKLQARRSSLASIFETSNITTEYLGPVAIIRALNSPLEILTQFEGSIIKKYHLDTSLGNGENIPYDEVAIFPIHIGISDKVFTENVHKIAALVNKGHSYILIN